MEEFDLIPRLLEAAMTAGDTLGGNDDEDVGQWIRRAEKCRLEVNEKYVSTQLELQ